MFSGDFPPFPSAGVQVPGNCLCDPLSPQWFLRPSVPAAAECIQGNQAIEPGPFSSISAAPSETSHSPAVSCSQGPQTGDTKSLLSPLTAGAVSSNKWHQALESHDHLRRTRGHFFPFVSIKFWWHHLPQGSQMCFSLPSRLPPSLHHL